MLLAKFCRDEPKLETVDDIEDALVGNLLEFGNPVTASLIVGSSPFLSFEKLVLFCSRI